MPYGYEKRPASQQMASFLLDSPQQIERVVRRIAKAEKPETGHGFSALARNILPGTRKNT